MRAFVSLIVLFGFPGLSLAADYTCSVTFECEGGSCRSVDRTIPVQVSDMTGGLFLIFDGKPESLVGLDRTSGGDLVFGGQLSDRLYGVFFLATDGGAKLIIEGVNGWSESRHELMICREDG